MCNDQVQRLIWIFAKGSLLCLCIIWSSNEIFRDHSKTCVKPSLSKRPKIGFQDQLSLNAVQKYCRMLQGEHSAILRPSLSYHLSTITCPALSISTVVSFYYKGTLAKLCAKEYHLSIRALFCLILRGRLTKVLLY